MTRYAFLAQSLVRPIVRRRLLGSRADDPILAPPARRRRRQLGPLWPRGCDSPPTPVGTELKSCAETTTEARS